MLKRFVLLLGVAIVACSPKQEKELPEKIENSKSPQHVRVKGSKIHVKVPPGYVFLQEMVRYQKNDKLYFHVIETNSQPFTSAKANFTEETFKAKGTRVDVLKNIKVNGYDAVYCEGPSKFEGESKMVLVFGDDTFGVMIVGVFETANLESRQELLEVMRSVWYDKTITLNPLELANFEFDQTITGFKYSSTISNVFVYNQNGPTDDPNPTANSIHIMTLPAMDEEELQKFTEDLPERFEANGIKMARKHLQPVSVNGYSGFLLETPIEYNSKPGIFLQVTLSGNGAGVAFMGYAYSETDKYLELFRKTVETLKLK